MSSSHPFAPSSSDELDQLGWNDRWRAQLASTDPPDGVTPARVLRHDGPSVLVNSSDGTSHVHLRPSTPPLTVGDWVLTDGDVVVELLQRTSLFQRRDPSTGHAQLMAANVDVVGIVCGVDRPLSIGRIERFSTQTWDSGASPLVILSKADLADTTPIESEVLSAIPGSEVLSVSSTHETGIAELLERCVGKTIVLVGESGAGKSTLLNALAGSIQAKTGEVREGDSKGRHTTSSRELHLLAGNCCLIDTPGVREVGLFTDVATVDEGFDDIADLATGCRFNDCAHTTEPGCAVIEAIDDGSLAAARLDSWNALRREAASAELRADRAAFRKESKRITKSHRSATQEIKRRRG